MLSQIPTINCRFTSKSHFQTPPFFRSFIHAHRQRGTATLYGATEPTSRYSLPFAYVHLCVYIRPPPPPAAAAAAAAVAAVAVACTRVR